MGFRSALGVSIIPPYETYIPYEVYIVPGLIGMVQLFNGMQSSLSMVYDREMGSMRTSLVFTYLQAYSWNSRLCIAGLCLFVDCCSVWLHEPANGLYLVTTCLTHCRIDAWCICNGVVFPYQAIGKFCRHNEFRNFSDVIPVFGPLPIVENTRE